MRVPVAFWLVLLMAGPAAAQDNAPNVVPPAPAIMAPPAPAIMAPPAPLITPSPAGQGPAPQIAPAVPPVQSPSPDNNVDTGQPPAVATNPAASWVAGKTARIGVLNKVDGSVSQVTMQVGGQTQIGDLQVSVLACMVRPPDQIPDAAVFMAAQSAADSSAPPLYRGWILRSAPGAAIVGDASETFRVIGCT